MAYLLRGVLFLAFFLVGSAFAAGDICVVCRKEIPFTVYTWVDKVTHIKCYLCGDCMALPDNCYLCSLPVLKDFTTLSDGRVICKRDVRSVVLDDKAAALICDKVKDDLDRQFLWSIALPDTNVTVRLMDRVTLQEIYKVIGNDFTCPNTLGCMQTRTNQGRHFFEISLLSGLPREELMTTCVHEYAHTWLFENIPAARNESIGPDAVEGFCELLAYLYAEQQGLASAKSNILANFYTRGQVQLFIEANRLYGLGDVIDWMIRGRDPLLRADDLGRVRWVADRPAAKTMATNPPPATAMRDISLPQPKLPDKLVLKGITGPKARPLAIINDQNFAPMDLARVPLAVTNLLIRCLEIRTNSVLLQLEESGATTELHLQPQ